MKEHLTFQDFWNQYCDKPISVRNEYFQSLSNQRRRELIDDFFEGKWYEVLIQNIIDERLDKIKHSYGMDLIDMRIQALKFGKLFYINKKIWESIEVWLNEFDDWYDSSMIFGGLVVRECGTDNQLVCVQAKT